MIPMSLCSPGETVRVERIRSGLRLRRRLLSMGLNVGDQIKVISNSPFGLIVSHNGVRLAVGPGAARRVFVTPLPTDKLGGIAGA